MCQGAKKDRRGNTAAVFSSFLLLIGYVPDVLGVLTDGTVGGEDGRLGADHKGGITVSRDGNTGTLEERPEAAEVTGVGIVRLGGGSDHHVKASLTDESGGASDSFLVLVIGNANSLHDNSPFRKLLLGY